MITVAFWWIVTASALFGAWLNARRRWQGFVVWIVVDTLLCAKAIWVSDYPQAVLWAAYTGICAVGLVSWRGSK